MYTVLTFRRGRLVREKAPVQSRWLTDGAALSVAGWKRFERHGQVRLRYASAYSTGARVWRGHHQQLRWKGNAWHALPAHKLRFRGDKRAHRIGGWHVRGLARW